jgi:hypothetical protein
MADQLSLRGGTTAEHATFTGANKEVTVDTTKKTLVVNDGATVGGHPLMRENASNSALALGSAGTPSLKFTGDTNTGIYSPGADQLAVATNGTGRLFVDANGNVGVGTSSPANFAGFVTLALADSSGSEIDFIKGSTVQGSLYNANDKFYVESKSTVPIAFVTNGAERLRITDTGLLGIGTSSPSELLTVVGNARLDKASSDLFIKIGGTTRGGNTYSNYIDLDNNGFGAPGAFQTASKGDKLILWGGDGPDSESRIGFSLDDAVWIKAMGATVPNAFAVHGAAANSGSPNRLFTITKAGKVGIGTPSPTQLLHVEGSDIGIFVKNTNSAGTSRISFGNDLASEPQIFYNGSTKGSFGGNGALTIYHGGNKPILFATADTERIRIDGSGRLLVGTSTARSVGSDHGICCNLKVQATAGAPLVLSATL